MNNGSKDDPNQKPNGMGERSMRREPEVNCKLMKSLGSCKVDRGPEFKPHVPAVSNRLLSHLSIFSLRFGLRPGVAASREGTEGRQRDRRLIPFIPHPPPNRSLRLALTPYVVHRLLCHVVGHRPRLRRPRSGTT